MVRYRTSETQFECLKSRVTGPTDLSRVPIIAGPSRMVDGTSSLPSSLGEPGWLLGRGALVGSARAPAGRRAPAPSRYPAGVERGRDGDGAGVGARGVIRLPRWGRVARVACRPVVQSHHPPTGNISRIPLGCEGGEAGRQGSQISDLRGQMGVGCEGGEAGSQI